MNLRYLVRLLPWLCVLANLSACVATPPTPTATTVPFAATATVTVTSSNTIVPTVTPTFAPTKTPFPTLPPQSPTPGPNLGLWYVREGTIYRYNMRGLSYELAALPGNEGIVQAALSEDGNRIAYANNKTLHVFDLLDKAEIASYEIVTKLDVGPTVLKFANDSNLLAYGDFDGLYIASIPGSSGQLLLKNDFRFLEDQTLSAASYTSYYPQQWSPDSQWLIVGVGKWEGGWPRLLSVSTGELFELNDCMFDMVWLPDNKSIMGAVGFSGWQGCGEMPGIYEVSITGNGVTERRIYHEFSQVGPIYQRDPMWLELSPNSEWIAFTYVSEQLDSFTNLSKLLVVSPDGSKGRELVPNGVFQKPLWALDGRSLYFTRISDGQSAIVNIDIDSADEKGIATVSNEIALLSLVPDSNWLIFSECTNHCQKYDGLFLLINPHNIVKIDEGEIQFLGWEQLN